MRRYLPELIALFLLPVLVAPGRYARRVTPPPPEAGRPSTGIAGDCYRGAALSLLAVGESPVAGVGVDTHHEAITGQLASALALRLRRPVVWRACGKNGVTARAALEQVIPGIPRLPVDIALVAFGVNDATAFRPLARWREDLRAVLAAIYACCAPRVILLSGVPPLARFPALPQPLRWVMGMKAAALDAVASELAWQTPRTTYVPLALDTGDVTMMAHDAYHPSAEGCTAWARLLADACMPVLGGSAAPA